MLTVSLLVLFITYTLAVITVDVRPIGPNGSSVGFAAINGAVFELFGTSELWYGISEVLGYIPLATAAGFALLGLFQLIKRRSIAKVDMSIYLLAVLYALVAAAYVLFEIVPLNFRPVLIEGVLEASYPSSHTMLTCCIMISAIIQFHLRVNSRGLIVLLDIISVLTASLTVIGRLLSGVHWLSDIVGAIILSAFLISLYITSLQITEERERKRGKSVV